MRSGESVSKRARDQALDALGEGDLGSLGELPGPAVLHQQAAVLQHADELLRVERVAAGALQDRGLHLGGQHRLTEELTDQR